MKYCWALDDEPGTGFWIQILCFSCWTLSRLKVTLPFTLGSVQEYRLTVVYYIHPVSWCQRALQLTPPKHTGSCVFEAAADFCNGWLIPWSWSPKLAHSEISLKHFANEHYLYGVTRGVSSPWVLDPVEVIKGCWRGTTYLQKGMRLVAWHQWSGIHWLEAISHVATKALNTSRSQQRRAGRGAAQLGYAMWCSHPAGPWEHPALGAPQRAIGTVRSAFPRVEPALLHLEVGFWCLDRTTPLRPCSY